MMHEHRCHLHNLFFYILRHIPKAAKTKENVIEKIKKIFAPEIYDVHFGFF